MKRLRPWLALVAVVAVLIIGASVVGRRDATTTAPGSPTPTRAAAAPADSATPGGIVVPTPAIPLPTSCPPQTAAQVDNPARYGFCTPVGWGAYNENNSLPVTLLMKPRPGGSPILQPTDFDRIVLLLAINTGPSADAPGECKGAPNDSIDGLAAHHCSAPLDPSKNPYHGIRADFWAVDLFADQKFYMTAIIGGDATEEDQAMLGTIVHNVKPPSRQ